MSTQWQLADNLLRVSEIKRNLQFLAYLVPMPTQKTMAIIERREHPAVRPFEFMAFGFSIMVLMQSGALAFEGKYSFLEGILFSLVMVTMLLGIYWITFHIFKRLSPASRNYEQFLEMGALTTGVIWSLQGGGQIVGVLNEAAGAIVMLAVMIYGYIYTMRTWKRFWQLSYGKIILYSLVSGLAVAFAMMLVLGALIGVALPFM